MVSLFFQEHFFHIAQISSTRAHSSVGGPFQFRLTAPLNLKQILLSLGQCVIHTLSTSRHKQAVGWLFGHIHGMDTVLLSKLKLQFSPGWIQLASIELSKF
ncbi:unnamed protein product [Allacma fusca]|uniref:Uncharacterized protein n=1 Tax=Allacma fusca TaxID=39272 RepID=A0A8J2KDD3_9HEXA|nr:unnamed protein product [Allacma fusca]